MIEHGIDIGWEHALVSIVHFDSGIGPPEEGLRQRGTVRYTTLYFQIGTAWTQRKAGHAFLMEHTLHLVDPNRHASILVLHNVAVNGQISGGTVVLGPVKLDAARYPRACQSHECGLDDVVVVHEINLVVRHLYTTAQLG